MKKLLSIILISSLIFSLSACGSGNSSGQEAAPVEKTEAAKAEAEKTEAAKAESETKETESPAGEPEVVHWDPSQEHYCNYENGKVILLETANVRISASTLVYEASSKLWSGETESDMALCLFAMTENLTDRDLTVQFCGVDDITFRILIKAGEFPRLPISGILFNWNGLIGETEDCFQGIGKIQVMDGEDVIEKVQFDWYSSEKTPFMNIITGDAVNFEDPAGKPAGENNVGADPNGSEASEKLGSFDLTMSMNINTTGEDTGLAEKTIEYFDEIKDATDGHVATEVHPGGTLAGESEIYDYLSDGFVDIGLINPVYAPDKFTLSNAFSLPLQGFDDSVKATEMIWDLYEEYPEFATEWDDKFEVLQLFVFPESIVKTNELTPLEEISGKGALYGICVNKELWNLLPSEYQEIIKDHSGRKASIASAEALKTNYRIQTEWLQGMGKTILDPSDEKYGQWKSACDVFAIQWAEEASAASGVDAAAFLNRAKELYAHY
ncbi:MAG: hypothetical protein IJR62_05405 [Lachnospiraceae bacterium]|nr:hypothetical protein [Lachnospiraceae bacterium]